MTAAGGGILARGSPSVYRKKGRLRGGGTAGRIYTTPILPKTSPHCPASNHAGMSLPVHVLLRGPRSAAVPSDRFRRHPYVGPRS